MTNDLATATDAESLGDPRATDLATAPLTWAAISKIAQTEFVPASLRGRPDAVLAAVFTGREIGLEPMASLRLIDVIDGRPSLSAELTVALIRNAGHTIRLEAETADSCIVTGIRAEDDSDRMTVTYTLEDAARAGLVTIDEAGVPRSRSRNGKPLPWETFTSDLLWARAVTRLARRLFPDVTAAASRTAHAAYTAQIEPVAVSESAALSSRAETPIYRLGEILESPVPETATDAEVYLRRVCRLAEAAGLVADDPLRPVLASFGARHVAELKAAEIREAAEMARTSIAGEYAHAVGRDLVIDDAAGFPSEPREDALEATEPNAADSDT